MNFKGISVSVWQAEGVRDPMVLPPAIRQYPELSIHADRTHPPVLRCFITAHEGDFFYVDLTGMLNGGAEELAVQFTVFGIDPLTGGKLATPGLRYDGSIPNFVYLPQPKRRNRYLDGWAVRTGGTEGTVAQFYWARPGSVDDVVAAKIMAQLPGVDFSSNMLGIKVFQSLGRIKSPFMGQARGDKGASVGAGKIITQGWDPDPDFALHGSAAMQKWDPQEVVTFVYEVTVLPKPEHQDRPLLDASDTGFFKWGMPTK